MKELLTNEEIEEVESEGSFILSILASFVISCITIFLGVLCSRVSG